MPLTEARRKRIALESDPDCRRASSRGLIPKAKVKTIKMTFVIVFGEFQQYCHEQYGFKPLQTNHVTIIYNTNELSLCHKHKFSYSSIFATQCRRTQIFQSMNSIRPNSISLKYQRFTPPGCALRYRD